MFGPLRLESEQVHDLGNRRATGSNRGDGGGVAPLRLGAFYGRKEHGMHVVNHNRTGSGSGFTFGVLS